MVYFFSFLYVFTLSFQVSDVPFLCIFQLMDLPEPVLIQILSYLDHDFLRNVAFFVSREWKRLAQSHGLWLNASLRIEIGTSFPGICEEPDHVR